jgi:hypothetical protein
LAVKKFESLRAEMWDFAPKVDVCDVGFTANRLDVRSRFEKLSRSALRNGNPVAGR